MTEEEKSVTLRMIELRDLLDGHKICFTHGDVGSPNVLIKGGGIAAIVDFEMSGSYPE